VSYFLHLFIFLNIYVVVALSLNIIIGYCGLLTITHAGYFAIGGYTYALATMKLGWGFLPATALGICVAALLSLAVSLPAWRFKGDSFFMISLAVQALLLSILYNWSSQSAPPGTWHNLTNGPFGLAGVSKPVIFGIRIDTLSGMAILSLLLMSGCTFIAWRLLTSPWGRLLKSMRDDELLARGLAKNVQLIKVQAFAIACGMAALAGAIYVSYVSYVDPGAASLDENILIICMVMVGGVGNLRGPILGAVLLILLPELLRFVSLPDALAANLRLMTYGLALTLLMHFRPQGLAGDYRLE
jgi:branched-chain amino acid transport system permease protein